MKSQLVAASSIGPGTVAVEPEPGTVECMTAEDIAATDDNTAPDAPPTDPSAGAAPATSDFDDAPVDFDSDIAKTERDWFGPLLAVVGLILAATALVLTVDAVQTSSPQQRCDEVVSEIRSVIRDNPDGVAAGQAVQTQIETLTGQLRATCTYVQATSVEQQEILVWQYPVGDQRVEPTSTTAPADS